MAKKSKLEIEREKLAKMQDDTASQAAKIKALEAEERASLLGKSLTASQWTAMWIFIGAIAVVALLGAFQSLRPVMGGKPMSMVLTIQMFMLMAGALIIMFTKTDPSTIGKTEVFRAGMIAVVAVFGIALSLIHISEPTRPY